MKIGDIEIEVHQLSDGTRVVTEAGMKAFLEALGAETVTCEKTK